jgi:arylsulfatase A-like enzyme
MEHMPLLIDSQTPTLQRTLKENGYTTSCFGKWHLGWGKDINPDWNRDVKPGPLETGFDYFFGVPFSHNSSPRLQVFVENRHIVGLKNGDDINNPDTQKRVMRKREDTGINLAAKATDFIRRNKSKPFFLYFPTTNVHSPYTPNARFKSKSGEYADYVRELDWIVGQITGTLEKEGLADNTLVIFTSDNGSDSKNSPPGHLTNGRWRGSKGQIYEAGHRVPFIIKWPGKVPAGTSSAVTICLTDIYATMAGILGIPKPKNGALDSYDFSPLFDKNRAAEFRRPPIIHHSVAGMFAIRDGDWKFIDGVDNGYKMDWPKCHASGIGKPVKDRITGKFQDLTYTVPSFHNPKHGQPAGQLYNLKDDPQETTNLYAEHPEIVKRLTAELKQIVAGQN